MQLLQEEYDQVRMTACIRTVHHILIVSQYVHTETSRQCSIHLINEVAVFGQNVTIDIAIIGPTPSNKVTSSTCSLDNQRSFTCKFFSVV